MLWVSPKKSAWIMLARLLPVSLTVIVSGPAKRGRSGSMPGIEPPSASDTAWLNRSGRCRSQTARRNPRARAPRDGRQCRRADKSCRIQGRRRNRQKLHDPEGQRAAGGDLIDAGAEGRELDRCNRGDIGAGVDNGHRVARAQRDPADDRLCLFGSEIETGIAGIDGVDAGAGERSKLEGTRPEIAVPKSASVAPIRVDVHAPHSEKLRNVHREDLVGRRDRNDPHRVEVRKEGGIGGTDMRTGIGKRNLIAGIQCDAAVERRKLLDREAQRVVDRIDTADAVGIRVRGSRQPSGFAGLENRPAGWCWGLGPEVVL